MKEGAGRTRPPPVRTGLRLVDRYVAAPELLLAGDVTGVEDDPVAVVRSGRAHVGDVDPEHVHAGAVDRCRAVDRRALEIARARGGRQLDRVNGQRLRRPVILVLLLTLDRRAVGRDLGVAAEGRLVAV